MWKLTPVWVCRPFASDICNVSKNLAKTPREGRATSSLPGLALAQILYTFELFPDRKQSASMLLRAVPAACTPIPLYRTSKHSLPPFRSTRFRVDGKVNGAAVKSSQSNSGRTVGHGIASNPRCEHIRRCGVNLRIPSS